MVRERSRVQSSLAAPLNQRLRQRSQSGECFWTASGQHGRSLQCATAGGFELTPTRGPAQRFYPRACVSRERWPIRTSPPGCPTECSPRAGCPEKILRAQSRKFISVASIASKIWKAREGCEPLRLKRAPRASPFRRGNRTRRTTGCGGNSPLLSRRPGGRGPSEHNRLNVWRNCHRCNIFSSASLQMLTSRPLFVFN